MKEQTLKRYGAFSLVEVLATVGIIAVLAALSFPLYKNVREAARSGTCIANLRQLGMACIAYSNENSSKLPQGNPGDPAAPGYDEYADKWHRQIYPYVNNGGTPATFGKTLSTDKVYLCPSDTEPVAGLLSYGFNRYLTAKRVLDCPKNMIILGDNKGIQFRTDTADFRHMKKLNVCYLDGHVETITTITDDILKLTGTSNP